jgi:DNA-binding transcriptional MocR family regulator
VPPPACNCCCRCPAQTDDTILAQAAAARGIGITALSPLHLARSPDRGLLLGFGRLPNHKIPAAVDALCATLRPHASALVDGFGIPPAWLEVAMS